MPKLNIQKLIQYQLLFIAITFMATSHGMVKNPQYPPITQNPNTQLDKARRILNIETIDQNAPGHNAYYTIVDYQKRGVCFNYAFTQLLSINEPLKILGCQDWITDLQGLEFFKQIKKPKKNCLAVYVDDQEGLLIQHVGIVINDDTDNITIRSKWGIQDPIVEHYLFHSPSVYGKLAFFYELKYRYAKQTYEHNCILPTIQERINLSHEMLKKLAHFQSDLYRLAKKRKPLFYKNFDEEDSSCEIASDLLRTVIGLDINKPNIKNKTILMVAAERGHLELVELFIELGADKNARNAEGTTAVQLADNNDHINIVHFLGQKKAKIQ